MSTIDLATCTLGFLSAAFLLATGLSWMIASGDIGGRFGSVVVIGGGRREIRGRTVTAADFEMRRRDEIAEGAIVRLEAAARELARLEHQATDLQGELWNRWIDIRDELWRSRDSAWRRYEQLRGCSTHACDGLSMQFDKALSKLSDSIHRVRIELNLPK